MTLDKTDNLIARIKRVLPGTCVQCGLPCFDNFITQRCVEKKCVNFCPKELEEYIRVVDEWWAEREKLWESQVRATLPEEDIDEDADTEPRAFWVPGTIKLGRD